MPTRTLLPEEKERIIELKLQRMPVRAIAAAIPTTTRTVQNTWNKFVQESAANRADLKQALEETVLRLEQIATDSRRGYQKATKDGDLAAAKGFLGTERHAVETAARLAGLDKQTIELTGQLEVTVAQDQAQKIVQIFRRVLDRLPLDEEQMKQAKTIVTEEIKRAQGGTT